MKIKQGKNEYHIYTFGDNQIGIGKSIHNGEHYIGKNTNFSFCYDCGKIIGTAMGGFRKHAASCKQSDGEWLKKEVQTMFDSINWGNFDMKKMDFYKALEKAAKRLFNFEPTYNCPN